MSVDSVNKAFGKQSVYFDEYDHSNSILVYMRQQVRNHVLRFLKPQDKMLELNAGTGLDAFFFANTGCEVYATELSDGMISQFKKKLDFHQPENIQLEQCSFTALNQIHESGFDYVFSNFGGLNCADDLRKVTKHLIPHLNDHAYVTWVIMPPVCPWELMGIFRGKIKGVFRRLKRGGTTAHLEGECFKVYYFSPTQVAKAFGNQFKVISLEGMGTIVPPPDREYFPSRYPKLFKLLYRMEEKLRFSWPFNRWADHFIITLQYRKI